MTKFMDKTFSVYPGAGEKYRDNYDRTFRKKKLIIKWGTIKIPPDPDPKDLAKRIVDEFVQDIIDKARASGKLVEEPIKEDQDGKT